MNEESTYQDEITLKELILKIKEFWNVLWEAKTWIILAAVIVGIIFAVRLYFSPQIFKANLTFMINEDEGNRLGGMANILGQFGFAGGGNSSEFNLDKIVELSRSRRIIYPSLMDTIRSQEDEKLIGNAIIDVYDYHKKWSKSDNEKIHNFYFINNEHEVFSNLENRVMKSLYSKVVGNARKDNDPLLDIDYGEETGILELAITSESKDISLHLVNAIFKNLSEYYITKTIEPQRETVNALSIKTDSIKRALVNAEVRLAQYDDSNLSLFRQKDKIKRDQLTREVGILTLMYGEAIKNLETASFTLQNKTPFFQIIDPPATPLGGSSKNYLLAILKGLILGGFLAVTFFLIKKIYLDVMAD